MAMPAKIRTEEWLKSCRALDVTPRVIKVSEYLEVKCATCETTGSVRAGNADFGLKKVGYAWGCPECRKKKLSSSASNRTGEKNAFYGKKHSEESKAKVSKSQKDRLAKVDSEVRKAQSKVGYDAMVTKYDGNCMNDPEVRGRHHEATHTEEFKEGARTRGIERAEKSKFSENQSQYSKKYWSVNRETKTLNQKKILVKRMDEYPDWKFLKETGFKSYLSDPQRIEAMVEKAKIACIEKYGVANWAQSDDASKRAKSFSSRAELEILAWVQSLGLEAKKYRQGGHEIDIYIEDKKIGIEYNGLYWHSEVHKENDYHAKKTEYFKAQGIRLVHIFEHEWRDRQVQVKSFLRSALSMNVNRVGARKCEIRIVPTKEANHFLETYHIQGAGKYKEAVGLYFDNQLLSLATFGAHHRKASIWTLSRFVTKEGWTIPGGLSRLSRAGFERFGQLISWSDNRWSIGNGYEKSGWLFEEKLAPDYFYTDFLEVKSKQSRKKGVVGTPVDMTEHEHALMDGLFRIYDCGKIRFVYQG